MGPTYVAQHPDQTTDVRCQRLMSISNADFQEIDLNHDDPMVITVEIAEYAVMKTLVDQ